RTVFANDLSDELNVRIRYRTRQQFLGIAKNILPTEKIEFGLYSGENGNISETFQLTSVDAEEHAVESPELTDWTYHGEIQGIIHSFIKEAKRPKLVLRELATKQLVNCFFTRDMYPH